MPNKNLKAGYIAVVGRPNVGKSTLMNALIDSKISIVSRKAQTTRHRIHGVLTKDSVQYIFVDTPGFQTRHGGTMNNMMNRVVTSTLNDVDVILHVVEAGKWNDGDAQIIPLLPKNKPAILVLSKVDLLKDKNSLFAFTKDILQKHTYEAVVPVSSEKTIQLDTLLDEISIRLPESEHLFDEEAITDRSIKFIASEIIREKIFRLVGDELPYECTVVIEKWDEEASGTSINACILVERENHKPILLGTKGMHMKRIASEARQDISKLIDKPVYLEIFIKVRKGWSSDEAHLRNLGYE
ncbi:GTPase Era [Taylorella equigenitalis]|uniref:GTPase Era n=2 Tax=Taylorella equigenitalis TaxID=29575 RepID=I7IAN9_9BURK|nr:GTPase Era [Taylorella equigenitalis]AFN35593.1 GTP-binding, Era-like protein [Taylorella equigenitalis ATCC 35865]ASY37550.1 GTPase Era [Taylorella equigenitalis]ASY39019.1 GTPase Era [Taylorella equigenitalis]ASY40538.1 GTPase Era [Taylorella equigenitalis]ASY41973.1 GTPase Era [Taylorella equigenitalis]